ncbi:exonuclease domain-containing protein [Quisquiliibacterium transsilvanicum]|uniref:DNA-directed DNA polymerase n=1 Tax=Quisquiliibacterium transsilvanicum TaxID=1549638 RepID=A0A7W8HH71_9BURK|nr:DNA polymerase-3 subunit epsilon [Quisquiliibacterium transsilvanicum]
MKRDRRLLSTVLVSAVSAAVLLLAWLAAMSLLLGAVIEPDLRRQFLDALLPHLPLVAMGVLLLALPAGYLARALHLRWVAGPARLLEQAQALLAPGVDRELPMTGSAEMRGFAEAINLLARQRSELGRDIEARVAQASRGVEQERNRLAALMSELDQSVVVCNLDGRILLYNSRARLQFRALSSAPMLADGAELIGLGRSIYSVFDRRLVAHALGGVRSRLQRGAANPTARFVMLTQGGQLLRVRMSPVRDVAPDESGKPGSGGSGGGEHDSGEAVDRTPPLAGFVLMLENVTVEFERESERDRLVLSLADETGSALARVGSQIERLAAGSEVPSVRDRLAEQARDEVEAMRRRLREVAARFAHGATGRWPLEEVPGAEFLDGARSQIEANAGVRCAIDEVDPALWLRIDGFAVLEAIGALAQRLRDEHGVRDIRLRLAEGEEDRVNLDLVWSGGAMSTETAMTWELDPIPAGAAMLTVREVAQRHAGSFEFLRDRARQLTFFRFVLPRAREMAEVEAEAFLRGRSRPEFYDFDLFQSSATTRALEDRRLAELAFTVFDTETTGLEPSAGDEIIQIGAVRVLNGKLRRSESFEQLVDPRRSIPRASIPIHGIEPHMVRGQPTIDQVLPAFHAYAQDTVLVAHNAAFDMRFLQLKEEATGVRFEQPVLDTLLLSAVAHPNQSSHRLEAIAERFGIAVIGRHTALGDALVTAEVLLRLIPLLEAMGIHTLGQAREEAQRTYFARLSY